MPLSDHEQEALEALEKALATDDPRLARRVGAGGRWGSPWQPLTLWIGGCFAGLGLLLVFCLTTVVAAGVLGFLVMFASLYGLWNPVSEWWVAKMHRGESG